VDGRAHARHADRRYAYSIQLRDGLIVTGMNDHVSWGLYISNFTFLVGLAAAAMMLVLPAYILKDVDFSRAVLIAEGVAVAALVMCLPSSSSTSATRWPPGT
jgi:Ni/Fe-hydrogenase subunit HybB-like protein